MSIIGKKILKNDNGQIWSIIDTSLLSWLRSLGAPSYPSFLAPKFEAYSTSVCFSILSFSVN